MADLKPISQFATASSVEANTLLFVSTPNQNNGYDSEKVSASELGEALVNDFMYTQDLPTVDKTITGSISEHDSVIGYNYDIYNPTTAYSKDDLCIYNNTLYKALQATTGNLPTNTTYWEQTSIADEISRIDTALSGKSDFGLTIWGTSCSINRDFSYGKNALFNFIVGNYDYTYTGYVQIISGTMNIIIDLNGTRAYHAHLSSGSTLDNGRIGFSFDNNSFTITSNTNMGFRIWA